MAATLFTATFTAPAPVIPTAAPDTDYVGSVDCSLLVRLAEMLILTGFVAGIWETSYPAFQMRIQRTWMT